MIHYHGCPITPRRILLGMAGSNFCNSFASPNDTETCHQIGQTNMLDNGAFTVWNQGGSVDWQKWYEWTEKYLVFKTTWAVLPDTIDGGSEENDHLIREWAPLLGNQGAPVWHLDEPLGRLLRLCWRFDRVCFGSAGKYATVRTTAWHDRVIEAFNTIANEDGTIPVWIHMLRGMALSGSHYPFSSVDSTDVARNHNKWKNPMEMNLRWDAMQTPATWPGRKTSVQKKKEKQLAMEVTT